MKQIFFPLLLLACALCSCNSGKLEWWEAVNTQDQRLEKANGRNDDSKLEMYLFDKMDALDYYTSFYRTNRELGEENYLFDIVTISLFFATIALVVLTFISRYIDDAFWLGIFLIILVIIVIAGYIPYYLFVENGSNVNTIDIGPVVVILALTFACPFIFSFDLLRTNRFASIVWVKFAYGVILPVAMIGGAIFRVVATYSSYLFILVMLFYIGKIFIVSVIRRVGVFRIIFSTLFKLYVLVGTVCILYQTMPAMVSILSDILVIVVAYLILSAPPVKYDDSQSQDDVVEEEKNYNIYDRENLEDTYKTDEEGHEIFQSKINGNYYKSTLTGYEEIDKPE